MLKRLVWSLAVPALLVPFVGCEHHHHHIEERERVVTYTVETAPPPEPVHEVVIERERPYPGAVWVHGFWERNRARHVWVWRPGHWQ